MSSEIDGAKREFVPYQAYLIRLWSTRRGGEIGTRVSVQEVATGTRKDLPDLNSLLFFLQEQMERPSEEAVV